MVKELVLVSLLLAALSASVAAEPLQDPLRPPGVGSKTAAHKATPRKMSWSLDAVLVSPQRSVAIINGQPLQLGGEIAGYRLVKIDSGSVVLQKKQKKVVVRRSGTGLKKALPQRDVTKGSQP